MSLRRYHYERAFEAYLRDRRIPYIAFEEARDAILAGNARLSLGEAERSLKSFDFLLYTSQGNLILDVKGRRHAPGATRFENWITHDDVLSLQAWRDMFGDGFTAAVVFVYWCTGSDASPLFEEQFEHDGRRYMLRAVRLDDYAAFMRTRSPRWGTVDLAQDDFHRIATPLSECCAPTPTETAAGGPMPGGA